MNDEKIKPNADEDSKFANERPGEGDEGKQVGLVKSGTLSEVSHEGIIVSITDGGLVVVKWNDEDENADPISPGSLKLLD